MKDLIISLFGEYSPVTYTVTNSDGTTSDVIASGLAGVDWQWVLGALVFLIAFYSLFRIIGLIFKR